MTTEHVNKKALAREIAIDLRDQLAGLVYMDEDEEIEFRNRIEGTQDLSEWADELAHKAHSIVGLLSTPDTEAPTR